jgi:hypothetical protein
MAEQTEQPQEQDQPRVPTETLVVRSLTRPADVYVFDNFYDHPDHVRELALRTPKHPNPKFYKGKRSAQLPKEVVAHVRSMFEMLLRERFHREFRSYFHVCDVRDPLVYHSDEQRWAAVVYLKPDAPPECGTSLWRHKETGLRRYATPEDAERLHMTQKEVNHHVYRLPNLLDGTKWELLDRIGNVYNRCIVWRSDLVHSATQYFGLDNEKESRLTQLFFFQ